ncbi:MAG TPA: hypothetical protein LFV66_01010 [Rickettsia endosymbiont of Bembidion lapponicum]|nr:hypothetical protein [Rickettsia endosymbiont of Bembidion lapponicum]
MYILVKLQKLATSFYKNIIILSLLLLCSCKATHDNPPNLPLPNSWNNYSLTPQNNQISKWWLQFNDPVLNNLIEESLANNSDIELAMSNIPLINETLHKTKERIIKE